VPLSVVYPLSLELLVENILVPIAIISGLIRPSSVGPQQVKLDMLTSDPLEGIRDEMEAAPTVRMFFAVPEVEIISYPSFLDRTLFEESEEVFRK
jgi:hypothetical protein